LTSVGGGDLRQLLPELEDRQFFFENLLDVLRLYLRHSIVALGSENRLRDEPFDDGVAENTRQAFSDADISVFQWGSRRVNSSLNHGLYYKTFYGRNLRIFIIN
jgi:hypothetical protein